MKFKGFANLAHLIVHHKMMLLKISQVSQENTCVLGPLSYLSKNLELPKCWTSEVPDGWHISFNSMRTHLSAIPIKSVTSWKVSKYGVISGSYFPVFRLNNSVFERSVFFLISSNLFPCLLWVNFDYWITCKLCWFSVSLQLSTFSIIFPAFLWSGISPDFTWIFID